MTPNSQSNFEKEEWSWRNNPSDVRLRYKAIYMSSRQCSSGTKTEIYTGERREKARSKPMHLWSSNLLTQVTRIYNDEINGLFSNWCWENCTVTCKIRKLEYSLTPHTEMNSKWIKELNIRPEASKLLQKKHGRTLFDINHSKILCEPAPRIMEIKTKINKCDLIKLKSFAQ